MTASTTYGEMLVSLRKFYENEQAYDEAIWYEKKRLAHITKREVADLQPRELADCVQRAAAGAAQQNAAARCAYFRDRAAMLAAVYVAEVDWNDRALENVRQQGLTRNTPNVVPTNS